MNFFTSIETELSTITHEIPEWFSKHLPQISSAVSEANGALATASAVAVAVGGDEGAAVAASLSKVDAGVQALGSVAANAATASNLASVVETVGVAVSDLKAVGVTNAVHQAAINTVVAKAEAVTGVVQAAIGQ